MGWFTFFPEWKLSGYLFVKISRSRNDFPDSPLGLVLRLLCLQRNGLRISFSLKGCAEKRLLFVNSLSESSFVSRGATAFEIFWREVLLVETVLGESCDSRRGTGGSTVSLACSSACRSACRARDLKSPAPFSDQGLFRAIVLVRESDGSVKFSRFE
jgi:hypothetical protein